MQSSDIYFFCNYPGRGSISIVFGC